MALIQKYTDDLSVIEIYDDYKVNEKDKDELLKEIYDLCNEIAREHNFTKEQTDEHFYTEEELKTLNERS